MTMRKLFARMLPERPANVFRPGGTPTDRRSGFRVAAPKRVQVIQEDPESPQSRPGVRLGLMKNHSADGCHLFVQGGVTAERVWVRLFGGDPREEFIECQVVWRDDAPTMGMQPCGVQFERTLSREEFEERMASRGRAISA